MVRWRLRNHNCDLPILADFLAEKYFKIPISLSKQQFIFDMCHKMRLFSRFLPTVFSFGRLSCLLLYTERDEIAELKQIFLRGPSIQMRLHSEERVT